MAFPDSDAPATRRSRTFPYFRFTGTHREIGRQYGEACADLIHRHLELAQEKLKTFSAVISMESCMNMSLKYRPYVQLYAPYFDEEIQGLAEGAGISLAEAYFLQLRAELYRHVRSGMECTTFAVLPEAASNGISLIGQNADLPYFYADLGIVAEFVPDDRPACLMFVPAGQISYIGISREGLGVFANFLTCENWRPGFPRYMLSRYALMNASKVPDAIRAVRNLHRASSRNLIMLDRHGHAADLETIPDRDALILPENGILVHANHFVGSGLLEEERLPEPLLENSRVRHSRMRALLDERYGQLNASVMEEILRDRMTYPHTLSVLPEDDGTDNMTVASVIAEPGEGRIRVAVGPPHLYEYKIYEFHD